MSENLNQLTMKKTPKFMRAIMVLIALLFIMPTAFAQDEEETATTEEQPTKDKRPVKNPFESGYLINSQTILTPSANTLEMVIQHRFGKLFSGTFDMLGLYAPSNIRMGFNYGITDRILVGIGSTKNNKLQDVQWKYAALKQTRSGSIPVSVAYFGNVVLDARSETFPTFTNRLSYFHQIIISRKFSDRISLQLAPSYSHFNIVDSLMKHDNLAVSFNGRIKVSDGMGVIFEYDYQLTQQGIEDLQPKNNLGLGIEIVSSAHAFQIFLGSFDAIKSQYNILYNKNDFTKKEMLIGFNITRLWNF